MGHIIGNCFISYLSFVLQLEQVRALVYYFIYLIYFTLTLFLIVSCTVLPLQFDIREMILWEVSIWGGRGIWHFEKNPRERPLFYVPVFRKQFSSAFLSGFWRFCFFILFCSSIDFEVCFFFSLIFFPNFSILDMSDECLIPKNKTSFRKVEKCILQQRSEFPFQKYFPDKELRHFTFGKT